MYYLCLKECCILKVVFENSNIILDGEPMYVGPGRHPLPAGLEPQPVTWKVEGREEPRN